MNEEDIRAAFARHEAEAPDVHELQESIDQEVRRRRRRRTRTLTGGLAAVVALAIAVPIWLANRAGVTPSDVANVAAAATSSAPKRDLNLLILGSDKRAAWEANTSRSDTILIVHIPADRRKAYTISVERDLVVEMPAYAPSGFKGGRDKMNAAFYYGSMNGAGWRGGLELAERTLQRLTGVAFDGGAVLEYSSVKQIVDALGGVQVCVPKTISLRLTQKAEPGDKTLTAGCHTLNGADALLLMRTRYGLPNGGYDRDRNQQRVLLGVAEKVTKLNVLTDAGRLANLLEVKGLQLDLRDVTAVTLAAQLSGLTAADVVPMSLANTYVGGANGGEGLAPDGKALLVALGAGTLAEFAAAHPDLVLQR
ncbi:MAG: LCP family protein [Hamadaea sp.]|uniref:LCP family protein n=1 Tax=Hamadaea sp. TaxID=2024425 RepID=UPI0017C0C3B1|nr:LCP family protein [Hamadaea sp.]NUR72259.1 LCP family protein [Hamadaea sp.]NUT17690.1 LCP family protein [Hamadaea sp.]